MRQRVDPAVVVARPDVALRNSGPRLPNGTFAVTDDYSDPANGERVPRCRTCGMPDRPGDRLLVFGLLFSGKHVGTWVLCESDYLRFNPPPTQADADPLSVA